MKEYYRFPAIRVKQPFGEYYICKIPSNVLRKVSFSLEAENVDGTVQGVQRSLKIARLKEIAKFIDSDSAAFPNSIILGANFIKSGRYASDDELCTLEDCDLAADLFYINIPKDVECLSIIDGQHRLHAFEYSDNEMDLSCSIYLDLAMPYQAFLFSTINYNQGKVDKSLAYQLFGYELDSKEPIDWPPETLAVYLARILNEKTPLAGRIKYRTADELKRKTESERVINSWRISTAAIVEAILSLISKSPKDDRYIMNSRKYKYDENIVGRRVLTDDSNFPLRSFYIAGNDKAIEETVCIATEIMNDVFWHGQSTDSFLTKTLGVTCLFKFLKEVLLLHGVSKETLEDKFKGYLLEIKGKEDFADQQKFPASTRGLNTAFNLMMEYSGVNQNKS